MDSNEFDRIVAEKDAEIGRLRKRIVHLKEQRTLMEHKVIACGVAATHPDAQLAASGVYKTEWNSQQLEEVIALRTRAEAAEAKCAELEKEIESVRSQYLPHASLTIACQDYEAKLAAANEKCENARRTIAELTNSVVAATERADAAEAEVARLHKIVGDCELVAFDNCNPPQLWSWIGDWEGGAAEPLQRIKNAKDAVKEIADLTAQLAAANERAENAEARCAELQSKLTGCEKAIDELKKSYEAAEAKCAEQKRFAESMLAQAMDSQAQLAAANGSLADMTNKFMDAHKELAAATERVAALEKERDGLRDECERLRDVAEGF